MVRVIDGVTIGTQTISGQTVWGYGTSGQFPVYTVSGSWVSISGNISVSATANVSGQVVWGYGQSGQMPMYTVSGSWVTISGTLTASLSGQPVSVMAGTPLIVWQSGTALLSTYITTTNPRFLGYVEYSANSATIISSTLVVNHVTANGGMVQVLCINMSKDDYYSSGVQYIMFIPDAELSLGSGDSVGVQFSNSGSCTFYTQTVLR